MWSVVVTFDAKDQRSLESHWGINNVTMRYFTLSTSATRPTNDKVTKVLNVPVCLLQTLTIVSVLKITIHHCLVTHQFQEFSVGFERETVAPHCGTAILFFFLIFSRFGSASFCPLLRF